jgi:hypothetical protein
LALANVAHPERRSSARRNLTAATTHDRPILRDPDPVAIAEDRPEHEPQPRHVARQFDR